MSRLRESDLMNSVRELMEMFPQHSPQLIEQILRSNKGVIDSAITALLETPPDNEGAPLPAPVPPPPAERREPSCERRAAPTLRISPGRSIQHIFPPDFLRWPPDAKVICEDANGVPIERSNLGGKMELSATDLSEAPIIKIDVPQPVQQTKKKASKGWNIFKKKFRKRGGNYEKI